MNHKRLAIIAVLLLWSQLVAWPWQCYGQPDPPAIYFDYLTINEGLSHNTVFDVLQDRDGYLWVATQNGLNKYDGYAFERFLANNEQEKKQGFMGRVISALHEDAAGHLWVGTRENGLNVRKRGSDQFLNLKTDSAFTAIKGFDISSITSDKDGKIWLTTVGAGLLCYDPKTGNSKHYNVANSGLSNDLVFDVVQDKYGTLWVAAAGAGLNYLQEDGRFALSEELVPNRSNMNGYRKKMYLDDESIWLGTEGSGLHQINLKDKSYRQITTIGDRRINSNIVTDIIRGADSLLYIATDGGGLYLYDDKNEILHNYTYRIGETYSLNSNALFRFCKDRTGNLWIGTFNGGLNIIKKHKTYFNFFSPTLSVNNNLGHPSVLSIHESKDGAIWIGTDGGGLNKLEYNNTSYTFSNWKTKPGDPAAIRGDIVKAIFEDSQDQLWVSVFGLGADFFDKSSQTFRPVEIGNNILWAIAEDKKGRIWLGTLDQGLRVFDPLTRQIVNYVPSGEGQRNAGPGTPIIMTIMVDDNDRVWVGTGENGIQVWQDTEPFYSSYRHDPLDTLSLNNDDVRAIFQDSRGDIWVGTEGGGLDRWLGNGQFEHMTTKDGLIDNAVMGITEDHEGAIWVTTFVGISRIDPLTGAIRNFDFHTGENYNQFNQMAAITASDGRLYFGGISGLHTIRPEEVKAEINDAEIIFTDLKVTNQTVAVGLRTNGMPILTEPIETAKEINLSYADNSFSIAFAAIDFTEPSTQVFSYKMEGFDSQWQTTARGGHRVTYTNLDPGTFVFRVKRHNKEASITVHIAPPFWQTAWFRTLLFLFIAGSVIGTVLFIFKRREEAHQQQLLAAGRKILELENEKLTTEINASNSKLMFSSAQMAQKNEILTEIKNELKEVGKKANINLHPLLRIIDRELRSEDYWVAFHQYVEQTDKAFSKSILEKHPKLTKNDLRLCTLLRLNLSTKEIAALLNVSVRAVEQSRYRLKKRLDLDSNQDLLKYISVFF